MAWWRRGDATAVQRRRPSVQLGGQASIGVSGANARRAVPAFAGMTGSLPERGAGVRKKSAFLRNPRTHQALPQVQAYRRGGGKNGE